MDRISEEFKEVPCIQCLTHRGDLDSGNPSARNWPDVCITNAPGDVLAICLAETCEYKRENCGATSKRMWMGETDGDIGLSALASDQSFHQFVLHLCIDAGGVHILADHPKLSWNDHAMAPVWILNGLARSGL